MLFISILFILFFFILLMFCLVSHPIYYCGLLIINSLISGLICYNIYGFSWYTVLFCLVYVGGVYILFVFVSAFRPNNKLVLHYKFVYYIVFLACFIVIGRFMVYRMVNVEFREVLCNYVEGNFYICMCLFLVFGFMMLRMVMSIKMNYYR